MDTETNEPLSTEAVSNRLLHKKSCLMLSLSIKSSFHTCTALCSTSMWSNFISFSISASSVWFTISS
jgi:hypothetical protein